MKLVNIVPAPDQKAALDRGDVAAVAATVSSALLLQKQGYQVLDRASTDHPKLRGTGVTIIVHEAHKAHPQIVAAWREARETAISESTANTDDYYAYPAGPPATTTCAPRSRVTTSSARWPENSTTAGRRRRSRRPTASIGRTSSSSGMSRRSTRPR